MLLEDDPLIAWRRSEQDHFSRYIGYFNNIIDFTDEREKQVRAILSHAYWLFQTLDSLNGEHRLINRKELILLEEISNKFFQWNDSMSGYKLYRLYYMMFHQLASIRCKAEDKKYCEEIDSFIGEAQTEADEIIEDFDAVCNKFLSELSADRFDEWEMYSESVIDLYDDFSTANTYTQRLRLLHQECIKKLGECKCAKTEFQRIRGRFTNLIGKHDERIGYLQGALDTPPSLTLVFLSRLCGFVSHALEIRLDIVDAQLTVVDDLYERILSIKNIIESRLGLDVELLPPNMRFFADSLKPRDDATVKGASVAKKACL